jgi:hypothetical protein
MKILAGLLFVASTLSAATPLNVFGHTWNVPVASDWKVDGEGGAQVLHLVTPRGPVPGPPRRPTQFALLDTPGYSKVTVEADVKPLQKSLIIVFNYRDEAHFDYAHLSSDTGLAQPVHNGIFHVYGGERVRISDPQGPPSFPEKDQWYHVKLVHDGKTGTVDVTVNGKPIPTLHAVDLSLKSGKIGLGSFDETGYFKNVKVSGQTAQ